MCISKTKKLARAIISQGGNQEEYFDHKCKIFENILGKTCKTPRYDKRTKKYYNKFIAKTLSHEVFLKIREELYPNDIKTVTKE